MTLLLADGPNLMMRSIYASQGSDMSSRDGTATGAFTLFVNALAKHIAMEQPTHVVVVWEGEAGSRWRRQLRPSYKANRAPSPQAIEESHVCFALAEDFLAHAGIESVAMFGAEADDVIGAYWAHTTRWHVDKIVILSSDKDMLQLVGENPCGIPVEQIRLSSYGTETDRWGPGRVLSYYGVPPNALPSLLAIMGDKSDGIEGVPGLGPKKGAKLLVAHQGSLEAAFPVGHEYRERVLDNRHLIDLRTRDLYVMPPHRFDPPVEGTARWQDMIDFLDRYDMINIRERLLTGRLWSVGQDGPKQKIGRRRPAETTTRPQ